MGLKVIDSHFHIWDPNTQNLPWLETTDGSITKTYTFEDLKACYAAYDDVDFVGGVYVEIDCDDALGEDNDAFNHVQNNPQILACMLRSDVSPYMRVPINAVGIREPLHIDSKPKGRCLEPSFIEGLKAMAKSGIPFESCNRVEELQDAYDSFSQVPQETVVLNHLGNVEKLTDEYKAVMEKFAKLPNLYLKVSGFATAEKKFVNDLLEFICNTFDSKKLLYASNWPVVSLYSDFDEHFNCLRHFFGDDQDFFMNNAVDAYKLKL